MSGTPTKVRRGGPAASRRATTSSTEKGVISREVAGEVEHVGDLVTKECEQDRAAGHPGHAVSGRADLVVGDDMSMPVTVHVDQVRASRAVGDLRQLRVVTEHRFDAFVVTGKIALA